MDQIKTTGADVTIDFSGATAADQSLTIAGGSSMSGGTLTLILNKDLFEAGEMQQTLEFANAGDSLTLDADSALHITMDNPSGLLTMPSGVGVKDVMIAGLSAGLTVGTENITLGGGLEKIFTNVRYENGEIIADVNTSFYTNYAITENGKAGLSLINDILLEVNPQGDPSNYKDLAGVMSALDDLIGAGNKVGADKLASAVAGASTVGLSMAASGDMTRQLQSIRNRTMSMGSDYSSDTAGQWSYNGWINAESGSAELSGEGTAAGYDLSSWGGTVGVEVNVNENYTFGIALSSMYGSYSSSDVDSLSGDLNTNYLSLFARVHEGRWSHTFVVSGGLSDVSMTRTVSYADGSYSADGTTDGNSVGMLYEVGYTYALTEDSRTAWQPLLSIAFQSSTIDAYTETGSDAALNVGEQSMAYATLGLGARLETVIGESVYNRASVLSLRAMAKADFGDNIAEADISLPKGNTTQNVKSAERGQFGVEVGAGISIPVMSDISSVFIDASFEVRENQNSVSATAGYRFAF